MKILVCGDRNWTNYQTILDRLKQFATLATVSDVVIIEGGARGADSLARRAGTLLGFMVQQFDAQWETYGRAAGPIRNQQMLDAKPDLVLAFHNDIEQSKGTADMVRRARKAGVPVEICTER